MNIFFCLNRVKYALFLLGLCSVLSVYGQQLSPPSNAYLSIKPASPVIIPDSLKDSISNPLQLLSANDSVRLKLSFRIANPGSLDSIYVDVLDSLNSTFLKRSFQRDSNVFTSGEFLFRNGNYFKAGLGKSPYKTPMEVLLFYNDNSGTRSDTTHITYP